MSGVQHVTVHEKDDGQRLDRWLKQYVSYGVAQKLIRTGQVRVDGKRAKSDTRLSAGQDVRLPPIQDKPEKGSAPKLSKKDAEFIKSLVIYDDGDVVAINKPAGLASQGGGSLIRHVDMMLEAFRDENDLVPRLIHRLDQDTSGVMVMARKPDTVRLLGKAFKNRDARKIYWGIVTPAPERTEGIIQGDIGKVSGPIKDKMMIGGLDAKRAVTEYITIEAAGKRATFVMFMPKTGRTHQIRVHCSQALECPLLGDSKYAGETDWAKDMGISPRLHLHARSLDIPHPNGEGRLVLEAPLSEDLQKSWSLLGFDPHYKGNPFEEAL